MLLLAMASLFASMPVSAQPQGAPYPNKPIKLVVPFPAGGTVDKVARMTATQLGQLLSTQVVVENAPGAGGSVAATRVVKSAPLAYALG